MSRPHSPRPARPWSAALAGLAAGLGFILTAALAGHLLPPRELPSPIREKLAHLETHGDRYDTLFVGSSRIQNHVIPSVFDRLATAGGQPVRSFNLGIASLRTPEDGWLLDQILARKPARLRWIFLEIDFFQTVLQDDQKGTLRGVNWHDWPRFRQICRRVVVMKSGIGWRDKIGDTFTRGRDFLDHLAAFSQRSTHLGRGAQLFDQWRLGTVPDLPDEERLGPGGDGWLPSKRPEAQDDRTRQRLAGLSAEGRAEAPRPQRGDRVSQAVLGETIAKITRAGCVPILVIPPRTRSNYFVPSEENARRAAVIDLCDPARYPELYELRYRIDTSHLNAAGAEVFTRILAGRFLEIAPPAPR